MAETISPTIEDYLGLIYLIQRDGQEVIGARLAERLQVTRGTVTMTLRRMERDGLVRFGERKEILLTPQGLALAQDLLRRHMLAEWLLAEVLGMPWHRIHEEADRLEHSLSEEATARLEILFERPETCPHGNPMPGTMPPAAVPLGRISQGETVAVVRVVEEAEEQPQLLSFLEENGLLPGASLLVLDYQPFNETMTVQIGQRPVVLGLGVAEFIHVRVEEKPNPLAEQPR